VSRNVRITIGDVVVASPGNLVGMIDGDLRALRTVRSGGIVTVESA
jgi:hypothetical protein